MVNALQIRAARAVLQITQQELADRTALSRDAIKQAETFGARSFQSSLLAIEEYFETAGVRFAHNNGHFIVAIDELFAKRRPQE